MPLPLKLHQAYMIDALHVVIMLLLYWQHRAIGEWDMARPRDKMTRAQKQSDTINNINAHYKDPGLTTQRQRIGWLFAHRLEHCLLLLGCEYIARNAADLGVADLHTDALQRMEALLAAVLVAGEEEE